MIFTNQVKYPVALDFKSKINGIEQTYYFDDFITLDYNHHDEDGYYDEWRLTADCDFLLYDEDGEEVLVKYGTNDHQKIYDIIINYINEYDVSEYIVNMENI